MSTESEVDKILHHDIAFELEPIITGLVDDRNEAIAVATTLTRDLGQATSRAEQAEALVKAMTEKWDDAVPLVERIGPLLTRIEQLQAEVVALKKGADRSAAALQKAVEERDAAQLRITYDAAKVKEWGQRCGTAERRVAELEARIRELEDPLR